MASVLKHLRSSTADKRPTASGLADGQIAINTASGTPAMFFKDSNGGVVKVGPAHVGSSAPNASPAGSAGNSRGELWVNDSLTTPGLNYYTGSAFVNLTPSGTTSAVGLVELATNAETQAGADAVRAVTSAGLQSKLSDSISTTSSTTIASSTAVKTAYDLANAALPKSGGTVIGEILISPSGSLVFEGSSNDSFETTLAVVDPTADRTITLPNTTGTVITTGDTGTVTSTMIANGTIVDADISATAEIAVSKLADGAARQLLQTDAAGTGVEWASNIDIPGTLDVTSAATFDSTIGASAGAAATPSITFTGDLNTGIYSPGADQVAISTNGTGRLLVDSSGRLLVGTSTARTFDSATATVTPLLQVEGTTADGSSISITRNSGNDTAPILAFGKSRSGTVSGVTSVIADDRVGVILFEGADGSALVEAASIAAEVDGTPGAGDMPGRLVFSTTSDGASSPTERLRITSNGTLRLYNSPGIDFSQIQTNAAGVTSEILDSYEEGTWTVQLYDAATGGNVSATTSTGGYTKVGRQVTARFNLPNISTAGMTAGNAVYFTLPFTAEANAFIGSAGTDSITFSTGRTQVGGVILASASRGTLMQFGSNVTDINTTVSQLTSGSADIRMTITYFVA